MRGDRREPGAATATAIARLGGPAALSDWLLHRGVDGAAALGECPRADWLVWLAAVDGAGDGQLLGAGIAAVRAVLPLGGDAGPLLAAALDALELRAGARAPTEAELALAIARLDGSARRVALAVRSVRRATGQPPRPGDPRAGGGDRGRRRRRGRAAPRRARRAVDARGGGVRGSCGACARAIARCKARRCRSASSPSCASCARWCRRCGRGSRAPARRAARAERRPHHAAQSWIDCATIGQLARRAPRRSPRRAAWRRPCNVGRR